ncbi:LysR substrate-binding domain-containing protein, partial [Sabulibacter ruber]
AVRAAVEAGAGATVISRLVVASALRAGTLVRIPLSLPKRRFLVLRHRERHETRAERAMLALLEGGPDDPAAGA